MYHSSRFAQCIRHGLLRWGQGGLKRCRGCEGVAVIVNTVNVCTISRLSVQWLRGVLSRPTQVHHAPEWPPVSLVWLSLGYDVEQTLVPAIYYLPAPILPEKRRTTRVYVIIRDGTASLTANGMLRRRQRQSPSPALFIRKRRFVHAGLWN